MANAKGSANIKNMMHNGKHSLLPPKCPFPGISSSFTDYGPNSNLGLIPKSRDGNVHHQRTSSESVIEEQPLWLDDLLNEPETPVRKGHRRSSSDSFAYFDSGNMSSIDYVPVPNDETKLRTMVSSPFWGFQNFELSRESLQGSHYIDANYYGKPKNRPWESKLAPTSLPSRPSSRDGILQGVGLSAAPSEADPAPSTATEKQEHGEYGSHDLRNSLEKKDGSDAKLSSESDAKRAKQQFAQRSRVRKLQYIAELESNVQALQAEGSEVSAELEFLNQQNLILSMENKALKQRLENLAQEKLIKHLEHEVLEREIGRLRALYQQQQLQPQQPHPRQSSSGHRRSSSRDLDSQFASLGLKHNKEPNAGTNGISGSVRI